ncbi:rab escort protein [Wolffia australiana]
MAAMAEDQEPIIEPSSFDLIISGTGLVESMVAAAASSSGKSILHIDPNPFYGAHFSSLSPKSLSSFLAQNAPLYSIADITGEVPEPSRSFLIDLSGPRVIYCADPIVDVMLNSGASHHIEFKSIDRTLIYLNGKLQLVPDSREAIFKDKNLSLTEKTQMTRFLKLIRGQIASEGGENTTSDEDLRLPFVNFLEKERLPAKIKQIILYAIVMADYDQENPKDQDNVVDTKEGLERLSVYSSSIGRFPNAVGALIYPMYGHGELPQAFCRLAAVKGTLYVLRMSASSLLYDEEEKTYKGVRLSSGQDVYCKQILMDSSSLATLPLEITNHISQSSKIARMICITKRSVFPELSNILVVLPPRSLSSGQETAIRVLQLGSGLAICPPGYFIVYCSVKCEDGAIGKEYLLAAINALFEVSGDVETEPAVVWSASFSQNLTEAPRVSSLSSSPMPDSNLDYRSILKSTEELFLSMYPQEEFFPASKPSEEENDNSESLGTDNSEM